jgi:hypothetical protein
MYSKNESSFLVKCGEQLNLILKLLYVFLSAKWFKYCWLTKDPAFCSEDPKNHHKSKGIERGIILFIVEI